jgi:hypothetical protein
MSGKIKRRHAYETTDGKIYSGRGAKKRAENHQFFLDMAKAKGDIAKEARVIFNVSRATGDKMGEVMPGELSGAEEEFLIQLRDNFGWDFDDFEEFVNWAIDIFVNFPGPLEELLHLLKKYHSKLVKGEIS